MTGKEYRALARLARLARLVGSRLAVLDNTTEFSEAVGQPVTDIGEKLQHLATKFDEKLQDERSRHMCEEINSMAEQFQGETSIIRIGTGSKSAEGCDCDDCRRERAEVERRKKGYQYYIERLRKGNDPSITYTCPSCSFTLTTRQIVGDTMFSCPSCHMVSCPSCQDIHFCAFTSDGDLYVTAREEDLEAVKRGDGECLS